MGGIGSGLCTRGQVTTQRHSLDVRRLQKLGLLIPGKNIGGKCLREGEELPRLHMRTGIDEFTLTFGGPSQSGLWKSKECHFKLERTPCHLGGTRVWFLCRVCKRRAAILYLGTGGFSCRSCNKLTYRCQRETDEDRALRHVNNLRKRLGWLPGYARGLGGKPKGMHWKTFNRLVAEHTRYLLQATSRLEQQYDLIESKLSRISESMNYSG